MMSDWKYVMIHDVDEEDVRPFLVKALTARRVNEASGPFNLEYSKSLDKMNKVFKEWFYIYYFDEEKQQYVNRMQFYPSPKLKEKFVEMIQMDKYKNKLERGNI